MSEDVDQKSEYLLNGFIRNITDSLDYTIPQEIILLIMSFYYLGEYFEIIDDRYYEIGEEDDRMITRVNNDGVQSIYGHKLIRSTDRYRYIWHFKLMDVKSDYGVFIGISSDYDTKQCFAYNEQSNNYSLSLNGNEWVNGGFEVTTSLAFKSGDEMFMEYDGEKKQLSFTKNELQRKIVINEIEQNMNKQYRMGVRMGFVGSKIKLLSFQRKT